MTGDLMKLLLWVKLTLSWWYPRHVGQQMAALSGDVAVYWMGRALALPREENGFKEAYLGWMYCVVGRSPGIRRHASDYLLIRDT
jgi:hypothetical protein